MLSDAKCYLQLLLLHPVTSLQYFVQVVEQLVSPTGTQQTTLINRLSQDAGRPPSWLAGQTPAGIQSAAGTSQPDKPVMTHSAQHTPSAGMPMNDGQVICICVQAIKQ